MLHVLPIFVVAGQWDITSHGLTANLFKWMSFKTKVCSLLWFKVTFSQKNCAEFETGE